MARLQIRVRNLEKSYFLLRGYSLQIGLWLRDTREAEAALAAAELAGDRLAADRAWEMLEEPDVALILMRYRLGDDCEDDTVRWLVEWQVGPWNICRTLYEWVIILVGGLIALSTGTLYALLAH